MTFSKEQIEALKAPLNKGHVKQRSQAGRSLSYIEGWHAIDEANRIFGFDSWNRETVELRPICEPYQDQTSKWRVCYMAKVRICVSSPENTEDDDWRGSIMVVREGCGYGSGIDKDLGSAHESALKEAETDAMKRALMTFGNPFGLALYDKEQKNVVDEPVQQDAFGLPPVEEPTENQKLIFAALKLGIDKAVNIVELVAFLDDAIKPQMNAMTARQRHHIEEHYKGRYRDLRPRAVS